MTETRYVNDEYSRIGAALIREEPAFDAVRDSEATIVFLGSDKEKVSKGRVVYGECERVADKNKWAMPCDFTVTLYDPNCAGMDKEHLRRVIFHELLHVGIEHDKDGNEKYFVVPHDFEDFRECVERWGVDWQTN